MTSDCVALPDRTLRRLENWNLTEGVLCNKLGRLVVGAKVESRVLDLNAVVLSSDDSLVSARVLWVRADDELEERDVSVCLCFFFEGTATLPAMKEKEKKEKEKKKRQRQKTRQAVMDITETDLSFFALCGWCVLIKKKKKKNCSQPALIRGLRTNYFFKTRFVVSKTYKTI